MFKTTIIFATLAAYALAITNTETFRSLIKESREDCRDNGPRNVIDRTCPGDNTIDDVIAEIPGGWSTVNAFASSDFRKTLDLCNTRRSTGVNGWAQIRAGRAQLGTAATSENWEKCQAQIDAEQADCGNALEILCAFSQGTSFECAPESQIRRTAGTVEHDECFLFAAKADGRPSTKAEFEKRLEDSAADCDNTDRKYIDANCAGEPTMVDTINNLPAGVDWQDYIDEESSLGVMITTCVERERVGWGRIRTEVARVYPGADNREQRLACLEQLRVEQNTDCRETRDIVCAFSYGLDVSCTSKAQQQPWASSHECDDALRSIIARGN